MSTELTNKTNNQTNSLELSQRQRLEQHFQIGVKAKIILGQFWSDWSMSEDVQSVEIENWMGLLRNMTIQEVDDAWEIYQIAGPRTALGKLCKPDAGYLWRIIMQARHKGWPTGDYAAFIAETFAPDDPETERVRARYRQIIKDAQDAEASAFLRREN